MHQTVDWHNVPEVVKSLPQAAQDQITANLPKGTTLETLKTVATSHAASTSTFMKGMWQLLAVYVATGVSMLIYTLLFSRIVAHSTNRMRKGLFGKLERLTISYFDRHQDGDILARFTSDLDNIQNTLNQALVSVISNAAVFVGVIIQIFNKDVTFAWLTVAALSLIHI